MLDIVLQILSVLGISLLVLLLIMLTLILLVLFFPITYRISGSKNGKDILISAKAKWLFGLFRVDYSYPVPGKIIAKFLWIKVFDTAKAPKEEVTAKTRTVKAKNVKAKNAIEDNNGKIEAEHKSESIPADSNIANAENAPNETTEEIPKNALEKFWKKLEKIKYTIRSICDKINMIWENIAYYKELMQEKNTRELFSHVCLRVGKILKSIRPRHLEACILMGTGSPDTTGYLYGVYGMLLSVLGPKVLVTPDFEQAVLEGNIRASGHITVAVLLINGLKLFFDKKLHLFLEKLKTAPGKTNNKTGDVAK